MRRLHIFVVMLVCNSLACQQRPKSQVQAPEPKYSAIFPRNTLSCQAKGQQDAQAWVDAWVSWQGLTLTMDISRGVRAQLPTSEGFTFTDQPQFFWEMSAGGVYFNKLSVKVSDNEADLIESAIIDHHKRRANEFKQLNKMFPDRPWHVLAIERSSTLRDVALIVKKLEPHAAVSVVFQAPELAKEVEPPPAALLQAYSDEQAKSGVSFLDGAARLQELLGGCVELRDGLKRHDDLNFMKRGDYIKSWRACHCNADIERLTIWMIQGSSTALRYLDVRPGQDGQTFAPDTVWGDVADVLTSGKCVQLTGAQQLCPPKR